MTDDKRIEDKDRATGYSVDIQFQTDEDTTVICGVNLGPTFRQAVAAFDQIVQYNVWRSNVNYVRLCLKDEGPTVRVLSRRTRDGVGDW